MTLDAINAKEDQPPVKSPPKEIDAPAPVQIKPETEPIPEFDSLLENHYRFHRKKAQTRRSKDMKGMVCDCILTKEDRMRKIMGCGEDCLNRILMIECGNKCPVGEHCANKRFQKRRYIKCEPFRAGLKGWGLRVLQKVEAGNFIMEYVGEVLEPSEFKARVKKYSKEKREHHYFMALKSDEIIDATVKGNITRFVNHSCEPTCETQKVRIAFKMSRWVNHLFVKQWTVNGYLRIGFFAIRNMEPGDEVTFNYQFERYGKEAQKCYCMTPSCRGTIGASDVSRITIDGSRLTQEEIEDVAEYDRILRENRDEFEDLAVSIFTSFSRHEKTQDSHTKQSAILLSHRMSCLDSSSQVI